jgi:hypothetical protein
MSSDEFIHPESKIAKLPRPLWPMAIQLRRFWHKISPPQPRYRHEADGMATVHNDAFMGESRFQKAYERGIKACGSDYGIPWRVHQAIWCADNALNVPGDFVELGVGRGFMMSAVLESLPNWNEMNRCLWLFDAFKPYKLNLDGIHDPSEGVHQSYASSPDSVINNFSQWTRVNVVVGDVRDTLPQQLKHLDRISFLHLDMNHGETEAFALELLWERLSQGAVVLMDDYCFAECDEQRDILNITIQKYSMSVLNTPTGQGIMFKH